MPPRPPPKTNGKAVPEAKPVDEKVDLRSLQQVTDLLSKMKQLRNYFQLERDKIHKFWDISRKDMENLQHELTNADNELEESENKHQVELKVYKQKVRHLMYEHRMQVQSIRAQSDAELAQVTLDHQQRLEQLRKDRQLLHSEIDTAVSSHDDRVSTVRDEHAYMMGNTKKQSYESQHREAQRKYEQKLALLRDELELRRRAEIHEIEEKKNEHINELIRKHEEAFAEMKAYYNHITGNNLELIRSLKDEIAAMKRNDENNEALMREIEEENKKLNAPLEDAKKKVAELQQKLHCYEKDKLSLKYTRGRLRALNRDYAQLERDHAELQKKFKDVQDDRDGLVDRFEAGLRDTMDVVNDKTLAVQEKLVHAGQQVDQRDAQLQAVLSAVNLEPAALDAIARSLEDALEEKNRAIKDLHFEVQKISGQHKAVQAEYERRAREAGIPLLDLTTLA